jgi:hypothetical protein
MRTVLAFLIAVLSLTACSEQKREARDTVFSTQVRALEKARTVEGKVQEGAQMTRDAVNAQDNPEADKVMKQGY